MGKYTYLLILLFALYSSLYSCKHYKDLANINHPAYIRVFNDVVTQVDALHTTSATSSLVFIADPKFTSDSSVIGGQAVGDFLNPRFLFSISYASTSGNTGSAIDTIPRAESATRHFEYPGSIHTLRAPSINGLDLSAWAQISSGTHRFLFLNRPTDTKPFNTLIPINRSSIILDTTINLVEGEVYTIELVTIDPDSAKYHLYVRQEGFTHQIFSDSMHYVSFYNLTGRDSRNSLIVPQLKPFNLSYTTTVYTFGGRTILPQYSGYLYTIRDKFQASTPFFGLPLLPSSYFFNPMTGFLNAYPTLSIIGSSGNFMGNALPYFSFSLLALDGTPPSSQNSGGSRVIDCFANPITFNSLDPGSNNSEFFNQDNPGYAVRLASPNINLIVNVDGVYHIYPTVNIFEVVYNRVYRMQIQRVFGKLLNN